MKTATRCVAVLLLAGGANAKEFQFMGDGLEAAAGGDAFFEVACKAFLNFNDLSTLSANEVMVMAVVAFAQQFEASDAITEIKALDHTHFLEQVHGTVNGSEVAIAFGQGGKDVFNGKGMGLVPHDFQNCLARGGELAGAAPEPIGEFGHASGRKLGVTFHMEPGLV
jgi:hypothetical protein